MGKLYRDLVRAHSKAKGSARALLNILADYATEEGLAWPTRETLANDTGMSERNVTRCLQKLCEQGRLSLEENAVGGRGKVPHYRILFPELSEKGDNLSPKRETDCHPLDAERVTNGYIKGDKSVEVSSHARREPQEPIQEPQRESAPARKVVVHKSPHLDPRHFVNGYIPQGTGTNAVEVYYERFSINQDTARLNSIKEDDLSQLCPDLDKLREVVVAYSRTTYQAGNVQLILDWYNSGIPEKHRPPPLNGYHKNGRAGDDERARILSRARMAREKIKTAELTRMPIDPQWQRDIEAAKEYAP